MGCAGIWLTFPLKKRTMPISINILIFSTNNLIRKYFTLQNFLFVQIFSERMIQFFNLKVFFQEEWFLKKYATVVSSKTFLSCESTVTADRDKWLVFFTDMANWVGAKRNICFSLIFHTSVREYVWKENN